MLELIIQAHFGPEAHLHGTSNALTAWGDRGHKAFALLFDHLHLTNTRYVYPFASGDLLCECLQIALHRFADKRFGQIAPLARDVGNSLGVIHDWLLLRACLLNKS